MQPNKLRRLATQMTALVALCALVTPGAAHIDPDTRTAYAVYGEVCIQVSLDGVTSTSTSSGDVGLGELTDRLRAGGFLDSQGLPLDAGEVEGLVTALHALLPEDATFTSSSTDDSVVEQVLEATACQYANGAVTHSHPHVHRDSTVFETEGMDGWWESTDTTGSWVEGNGAEDAGVLTLGGVPFVSTDVGGGVTRTYAELPPGCGVLGGGIVTASGAGELDPDSALWPFYYVGQYIHDARLLTTDLLVLDADFCGWGIGGDTDGRYELADAESEA